MVGQSYSGRVNFRRISRNGALAGIGLLTLAACSDRRRAASADSDLARDLQMAGQTNAQPTFQDTALSSSAATVRDAAPAKKPTSAPTRSSRPERHMSPPPAPLDVNTRIKAAAPVMAA